MLGTNEDQLLNLPVRRNFLDPARFQSPQVTDRPGMRWWWQSQVSPSELVRELRSIAEAGFGEVEIAFSQGFWADEAQRHALSAVLAEADKLGIGVAMTLGAEWPVRTPNTTTGTKHAAQELQYGVTRLGDSQAVVPIPPTFDDPHCSRASRLLAVTAARVVSWGDPPSIVPGNEHYGPKRIILPPEQSTVLDTSSLVDITPQVTGNTIEWLPRPGDWVLFAFWIRDSEQGATSFLDKDAASAATEYLDEHQIGAENFPMLRRVGTELFEDSLELNADSLFWSPSLPDRFLERHGYAITPYLPVLFAHGMCRYWVPNEEPTPDYELNDLQGARIRSDYYRLISDLYITDHLLLFQRWATTHGLRHKAQVAYGQNLEPVRTNREFVRHGGRAEGESLNSGDRAPLSKDHPNWRYALDWQRALVGGAHQGGTNRISTELGAQFGAAYALTLGDLKQMLDKEWAAGITKPFVHGFGTQEPDAPWPTQSRFQDYVSDTWNDVFYPEWKHWRPLTDYWARGTAVLETGVPRTDVAIYRDGFLTTAARGFGDVDFTAPGLLADTEALERSGYSVQYLDPIGLSEASAVGNGTLFPDGPAYQGLVVEERAITPEAAEAIHKAAARGLCVVFVGESPTEDSGFGGNAKRSERVKAAVNRALELPTVTTVGAFSETAQALSQLGVSPRVSWNGPPLLTQLRDAGDRRYILVYNPEAEQHSANLSIEGTGALRELILMSGETVDINSKCDASRTILSLSLAPLDLRIFELDLEATGQCTQETAPQGRMRLDVSDWRLSVQSVEEGGTRTIELDGQGPADWRTVDELARISGTGLYSCRVAAVPKGSTGVVLEFGELAGSATVRIGNQTFGPAYVSGTVLELGDALAGGEGTHVQIEVRTALRNAVAETGRLRGPFGQPCPHGLVGPVKFFAVGISPGS
ncbi:glycosyl hydrolase [Pseudarthrobacter sp. fls2-241-R2A-127]|uniref:glycosyl hydrolase n=1 Tax=Pseudarthrobacter sp. fls2-241-R2A-127 TaxID=3040303 RepID=UPI002557C595|nr:glycosyl hydrolase [Pseudarthrobacter sp. fls2-241-R2A-127]